MAGISLGTLLVYRLKSADQYLFVVNRLRPTEKHLSDAVPENAFHGERVDKTISILYMTIKNAVFGLKSGKNDYPGHESCLAFSLLTTNQEYAEP